MAETAEAELASLHAQVYGLVQGVNFRRFALQQARRLGLKGYVRNLFGGDAVEVRAEGSRDKLESMLQALRRGPPESRVRKVEVEWVEYSASFSSFEIRY